jgi:hypothetical protein
MQQSGQITAHIIQPRQSGLSLNLAGFTPLEFNFLSTLINPLGQTVIHKRQPLHFSWLIVILAIVRNESSFLFSQQSTRRSGHHRTAKTSV